MTDAVGPPEREAGGILTIDLAAIVANWRALGQRAAPAKCAAVVKADGYGCGLDQVAGALASHRDNELGIALVMSHFACSEEDHPLNAIQIERFCAVRAVFADIPGSLANSSGIFLGPEAHHDLVRPGVALYGANPIPGRSNPMQPVVSLAGRIVQLRSLEQGATVGYSATWTAKRPTRLAIVSVGYADGFLRAASASDARP